MISQSVWPYELSLDEKEDIIVRRELLQTLAFCYFLGITLGVVDVQLAEQGLVAKARILTILTI